MSLGIMCIILCTEFTKAASSCILLYIAQHIHNTTMRMVNIIVSLKVFYPLQTRWALRGYYQTKFVVLICIIIFFLSHLRLCFHEAESFLNPHEK